MVLICVEIKKIWEKYPPEREFSGARYA